MRQKFKSVVESYEEPCILQVKENLSVASFRFMKIVPAHYAVQQGLTDGQVTTGKTVIVESSSGNYAFGLALVCNRLKQPLVLVVEPTLDPGHMARLMDLGARIEMVDKPDPGGGYQRGRLHRLSNLRKQYKAFWPNQYHGRNNPNAYAPFAARLVNQVGRFSYLIGAVGSGGSMCGTSQFLRLINPGLRSVGVDTHGSVSFGHKDKPRIIGGLGSTVFPANLKHATFDQVHWVTAAEGFRATRDLHQQYGVYAGATSGAAFMVAEWIARRNLKEQVVVILPDQGERYASTVYSDKWLRENAWIDTIPQDPIKVDHPRSCTSAWSYFDWNRRSYREVMGFAPGADC